MAAALLCPAACAEDGDARTAVDRIVQVDAQWLAGPLPEDREAVEPGSDAPVELEADDDRDAIDLYRFALVDGERWLPLETVLHGIDHGPPWLALEVDGAIDFRELVRKCYIVNTPDACTLVCILVDDGQLAPDVGEG